MNRYIYIKVIFFLSTVLLLFTQLSAQDYIFNQFTSNPLTFNPAYAGLEEGTSIYMQHKSQWNKIGGSDLNFNSSTLGLSFELAKLRSGVGFSIKDNNEGITRMKWRTFEFSYAFHTRDLLGRFGNRVLGNAGNWNLSLGLNFTHNRRVLDPEGLVFSDQLDAIDGVIRPTNLPIDATDPLNGRFTDIGTGMLYEHFFDFNRNMVEFGFVVNHLIPIEQESLLGLSDSLPRRFTVHWSYFFNGNSIDDPFFRSGIKLRYSWQKGAPGINNFTYNVFDINAYIKIGEPVGDNLLLGVMHRMANSVDNQLFDKHLELYNDNTYSVGVQAGTEFRLSRERTLRIIGSYSYDYVGLGSDTGGTWEISLGINLPQASAIKCRQPLFYRPVF